MTFHIKLPPHELILEAIKFVFHFLDPSNLIIVIVIIIIIIIIITMIIIIIIIIIIIYITHAPEHLAALCNFPIK